MTRGIKTRFDILNERNEIITCQFQLSTFLNQLESFKNEKNKTIFFFVTLESLLNCVPYVLMCGRALRAYVLTCQRGLRAYVITCQLALCAYMLTLQRTLPAYLLTCQRMLRAYVLTMCLACLRAHML